MNTMSILITIIQKDLLLNRDSLSPSEG